MKERRIGKVYRACLEFKKDLPKCLRIKDKIGFNGKAIHDKEGKHAESLFIKKKEDSFSY